jgi:hypothetical protein
VTQLRGLSPAIPAQDTGLTRIGGKQTGEQLHGGGFARSIIPKKGKKGTAWYPQVQSIEHQTLTVTDSHTFQYDHIVMRHACPF